MTIIPSRRMNSVETLGGSHDFSVVTTNRWGLNTSVIQEHDPYAKLSHVEIVLWK